MARQVRNAKLDTRSARAKLPMRKAPYWASITPGCSVGYRKGTKGGTWLAKYVGDGTRRETRIGPTDDILDADNVTALSFAQAQNKAREWFSRVAKEAAGEHVSIGPYTVKNAADDYMTWFRAHRKSAAETQNTIDTHILPSLGKLDVTKLTAKRIRDWHTGLADQPPRLRSKRGGAPKYRDTNGDPDAARRRRSSANRILTVLKAQLNHAWQEGRVASDDAWRRVKPFKGADAARMRYLTSDECTRLVNACDKTFRPLVQAALLTGCRYGELTRMSVSDYNPDAGTVAVHEAKSGRPRHVVLAEDGQDFFEAITAGQPGDAPIFSRDDGGRWGKSHQNRPLGEACKRAKIKPAVGFHVFRHTYASHLVMNGAPMHVVAHNLGHADTRMVEKHYTHLQPSWVAEAIRAAAPKLGIVKKGRIVPLKRGYQNT